MQKGGSVTLFLPKDIDFLLSTFRLVLAPEGHHDALNKFRNLSQEFGVSMWDPIWISCNSAVKGSGVDTVLWSSGEGVENQRQFSHRDPYSFLVFDSCPNPSVQASLKETTVLQRTRWKGQCLISPKALGDAAEFCIMKRGKLVSCGGGSAGVAFHGIRLLVANEFIAKEN